MSNQEPEVYRITIPHPSAHLALGLDEDGNTGLHARVRASTVGDFWQSLTHRATDDTKEVELMLGRHSSGFIGVFSRVEVGSIFFGAGGGVFKESHYNEFRDTMQGINLAVNGTVALLSLIRSIAYWNETSKLDDALNVIQLGAQVAKGAYSLATASTTGTPGEVAIYGDRDVAITAPISVDTTTLGMNTMSGALSSVNGMIKASLSAGVFASVNGLYSASVSGLKASLVGDTKARVVARGGIVSLEGKSVQVGRPSGVISGTAGVRTALDGRQDATAKVRVDADERIELHVGQGPKRIVAPTRVIAQKGAIRAETTGAALFLEKASATVVGENAIAQFNSSGITLSTLAVALKKATNVAIGAADAAHATAVEAARQTASTSDFLGMGIVAAAVGAHVGAITAAATAGTDDSKSGGEKAGLIVGAGLAGGAAAAAVATLGAVYAVRSYLASKAEAAALAIADKTREVAVEAAMAAESLAATTALAPPMSPKVKITKTSISLSVGMNAIKILPTGIVIEAKTGGIIMKSTLPATVNGNVIMP